MTGRVTVPMLELCQVSKLDADTFVASGQRCRAWCCQQLVRTAVDMLLPTACEDGSGHAAALLALA
jgi:hypothetical protein